jgi:hypothetical protein
VEGKEAVVVLPWQIVDFLDDFGLVFSWFRLWVKLREKPYLVCNLHALSLHDYILICSHFMRLEPAMENQELEREQADDKIECNTHNYQRK